MLRFGLSNYLKLVSLNPKPQKTLIRNRLLSVGGPSYDYHRSLKLAVRRLLSGETTIDQILLKLNEIKQESERLSAIASFKRFVEWRAENPGTPFQSPNHTYHSPSGRFEIGVQSELGLQLGSSRMAYFIWNNKTPDLNINAAYETLALLPDLYTLDDSPPSDVGILSLLEPKVLLLSEHKPPLFPTMKLVTRIELLIDEVRDELGLPGEPTQPPIII